MKIKLLCDKDKYEEYKNKLQNKDLTFTESDPDLVVVDPNYRKNELIGKNSNDEYQIVNHTDIIYVESYGHDIIAHTTSGKLYLKEKLYEIEGVFEEKGFLRVHRSYVINKSYIKTIKPTFNTKFIITMKNDDVIEVSRSYYYIFKKSIGL